MIQDKGNVSIITLQEIVDKICNAMQCYFEINANSSYETLIKNKNFRDILIYV